jgi:uncharacterized membrane protein
MVRLPKEPASTKSSLVYKSMLDEFLRIKWLILVVIVINAGYFFVTPAFQAPDETRHFERIFQLSDGSLLGEKRGDESGWVLPKAVVNPFHPDRKTTFSEVKETLAASPSLNEQTLADRAFCSFPNTVLYSPVCYLPQIAAAVLARVVHTTVLTSYYLERLFSISFVLLTSFLLFFLARKYQLDAATHFLALFTPMAVFLANSISADSVIICLSIGFGVFSAIASKSPQKFWWRASLATLVLISICKFVYFPLGLLVFPSLVRSPSLNKTERRVFLALFSFLPLIFAFAWLSYVQPIFVPSRIGVNPGESLKYLFAHFPTLAPSLVRSVIDNLHNDLRTAIGFLGWLDAPLPSFCYKFFCLAAFILVFTKSKEAPTVSGTLSALSFLGAFLGTATLIYFSMYLSWTIPGSTQIEGVQGRYFLPMAMAFAFSPFRIGISPKLHRYGSIAAFALILMVHLGALSALYYRYWI